MAQGEEKKEKVEQTLINILIYVLIPTIIGVLFYVLLFKGETPLIGGGLAVALAIAIAGLLLTIRGKAIRGAYFMNGGMTGFLTLYCLTLSRGIADSRYIWLLWFLMVLISAILCLINVQWLGTREKISHDLFIKLGKSIGMIFLLDFAIIIIYSSYSWWFGNIFSSLGLGLLIIGVILPIFRNLIATRIRIYIFSMLPINMGISLLIFGGVYIAYPELFTIFLTSTIGFFINLLINGIIYNMRLGGSSNSNDESARIFPIKNWFKLFFLDFLGISISGSLLFITLFSVEILQRIMIALLWFTTFSFATIQFAHKAELLSRELKEKLWVISGFGITFEISFLISFLVYYATTWLLAFGSFIASSGIFILGFNFLLNKKFLFYFNSISITCGFGIIVGESLFLRYADVLNALVWAFFVVSIILMGILLLGWVRKFLEKQNYFKINFYNWICFTIIMGLLIGLNTQITGIQLFLSLLIASFIIPIGLIWADAAEMIGTEWANRLYRLNGILVNLQLANLFSLYFLQFPTGWIRYLALIFIIFSFLTFFLLNNIREKRLILLDHLFLSFGISLMLFGVTVIEDPLLNLIFSTWIGVTVFSIIIPICFKIDLLAKRTLFRLSCGIFLFYMILSTWLLNSLIPYDMTGRIYLLGMFVVFMLLFPLYFGLKGETLAEKTYFGFCSADLSAFIIFFSIFFASIQGINYFYQIVFLTLFIFVLLIPDIYLLHRVNLIKESYYRKMLEGIGHILCGICALLLAGIPVVLSANWILGIGIFLGIFSILSGLINLRNKRNKIFLIQFSLFIATLFSFLYSILIIVVVDIVMTIFWALFIELILILFTLDMFKQYRFLPPQRARLGIVLSSIALSFIVSFLIECYLLVFNVLAIISSVYLFILLTRVIILYIQTNNLFPEARRNIPSYFSLWSCLITNAIFFYFLINTLNPSPLTLGFQLFNIIVVSSLFIGTSCAFSEPFRKAFVKFIVTIKDAFIKLITNRVFLTGFSTFIGGGVAVHLFIFYGNLFFGINIAILIILICYKAIYSYKYFSNYFIVGVPVVIGAIFYKLILNFIDSNFGPLISTYFDNLYVLFYVIGICALLYFFFSFTFWKFKSALKYGFLIGSSLLLLLPIIYLVYFMLNPLLNTYTEYFLGILPWLISIILMVNVGFSYYFRKQSWIFFSICLIGLYLFFDLLAFYLFFPTLDFSIRLLSSLTVSGGLSFFIFSVFARYFEILSQKRIMYALGTSVISGSIAVGVLLHFYQGIDLVISIGLAIDFAIFMYYLSAVCYFWELSKKIWEKGWLIWVMVPVINAFIIFLSFVPLGTEFIIFGTFLALAIGYILFLPVIFYRWRSNFRLSWFIVWAEMIPLSFSVAYYFMFQELFASAIFMMGIITILLALLIYFIKMWRISAILWFGLSIANGFIFFISGLGVIAPIALIGISLLIAGLQASTLTIFPTIPIKYGAYIWMPVTGGITILAVYFALLSHFDVFLTVFFAGIIFLLSLYPLILFGIEKKQIYQIIGFGLCPILPFFTGFLIYNTLVLTIIDEVARTLISVSISMIILGFILLILHKFEVLKREYWGVSWAILSASTAALFGWFGFYVFHIIDNIINLTLSLLIFELILIPAAGLYRKYLGEAIIVTVSVLLGVLVNIFFGIAVALISSAGFLQLQKPLKPILKIIQELSVSIGLFFFLFWGLQIVIELFYAFLIAGYITLFYPFARCMMEKRWLTSTLFWIGLIIIPVATGIWLVLDTYLLVDPMQSILLTLCTIFSLCLVLPAFHKVPKKYDSIFWIGLGGSISIYLYTPLISVLLEPFVTVILIIIVFTLFCAALPRFNLPSKLFLISITILSIEFTLLLFNYIYIFTFNDILLTSLYAFLIESIIILGFSFWKKQWTGSMLIWFFISISLGLLYCYYAFLNLGILTLNGIMTGLLISGGLVVIPTFSEKLNIDKRFLSYLIFSTSLSVGLSYFSSFIFLGDLLYLYSISFGCFLFASFLLIFYQWFKDQEHRHSFLDRFFRNTFWILLSVFNNSCSILIFWCFSVGLSSNFESSLIISVTVGYILFLLSKKFRTSLEQYLQYLFMMLPVLFSGVVFLGFRQIMPSFDIFLLIYISLLVAFLAYWGLLKGDLIIWRIHEYLWAFSPIPLVIYVGNLINIILVDIPLVISAGVLIYVTLLVLLFIVTSKKEIYTDYLWIILTVSLTFTLHFSIMLYSSPENIYFSLFLAITMGLGTGFGRALWKGSAILTGIIYIPLIIISSATIYFALADILMVAPFSAFLLALFACGNLLIFALFFPNMNWQNYRFIWLIIVSCFSFVGGSFIWLASEAWLPTLIIGLNIFAILWIKPPYAPPDFVYRKYCYSIIVLATNIGLGWVYIVLMEIDIVIGILLPILIGNLLLLALSVKKIIPNEHLKRIYLGVPLVIYIMSYYSFFINSYPDIYLCHVIPILIGLLLIFPIMPEYNPFRFLSRNTKFLIICIAGVMAPFTFLVLGYVQFVGEQMMLKGVIAAVVVIGILYPILPRAYQMTEYTFLYLSIVLTAIFSIIYLLIVPTSEFWMKLVVIFILSIAAVCLGSYRIIKKKGEENPRLNVLRTLVLIIGFSMIVLLIILLFAFSIMI